MCRAPEEDHTSEEVKDKGAIFLSMDYVDHEIVKAMEEQGKTTIEDFDMVSYGTDRPMNLIVMLISEKSIGSS